MDRMATPRSYEDFIPSSEWIREEGVDTLIIELPGFRKEQLRVQLDNYGNLRTSGERPLDAASNRWRRFRKEFRTPENCNAPEIRAKFENGILMITLPKLTTTTQPQPQLISPPPSQQPEKPEPQPEATGPKEPKTGEASQKGDEVAKDSRPKETETVEASQKGDEVEKEENSKGKYRVGMKRRELMIISVLFAAGVLFWIGMYVIHKQKKVGKAGTERLIDFDEL